MAHATHFLFGIGWDETWLFVRKKNRNTYILLNMKWDASVMIHSIRQHDWLSVYHDISMDQLIVKIVISLATWWWWDVMMRRKSVSLTAYCWWDVLWWDCLTMKKCSVAYTLLVMDSSWDLMRLPGKQKKWYHSLPTSHRNEMWWVQETAISLTICWLWVEMQIRLLGKEKCSIWDPHPVGHWIMIHVVWIQIHYHSLPVGHSMRVNETAWKRSWDIIITY